MRRLRFLAIAVVLVTAVAACSSSKKSTDTAAGSTTTTAGATATTADSAAFATGLGWFYSTSDSTAPANVPQAVSSCVQGKLKDSDATIIVAVKSNADSNNVADSVGIRVIRDTAACDRAWLATYLGKQLDLGKIGVTSADQQSCVTSALIDNLSAANDATATGTGGSGLKSAAATALGSCVTVTQALTAVLSDPSNNIPAASVDCIATTAAKTITWTQLINQDSEVKTAITAAATSCAGGI